MDKRSRYDDASAELLECDQYYVEFCWEVFDEEDGGEDT